MLRFVMLGRGQVDKKTRKVTCRLTKRFNERDVLTTAVSEQ